jgi:DNA-binding NarL/FixJ family response regulator
MTNHESIVDHLEHLASQRWKVIDALAEMRAPETIEDVMLLIKRERYSFKLGMKIAALMMTRFSTKEYVPESVAMQSVLTLITTKQSGRTSRENAQAAIEEACEVVGVDVADINKAKTSAYRRLADILKAFHSHIKLAVYWKTYKRSSVVRATTFSAQLAELSRQILLAEKLQEQHDELRQMRKQVQMLEAQQQRHAQRGSTSSSTGSLREDVQQLKQQGLTQKQVSLMLKKCERTVRKYWN